MHRRQYAWRSRRRLSLAIVIGSTAVAASAEAKPIAPDAFCATYPLAPACASGATDCKTCHVKTELPVVLNAFGTDVSLALEGYIAKPFDDTQFLENLPQALHDVENLDSDGDGLANVDEVFEGSLPGDAASVPTEPQCPASVEGLDYSICQYDRSYTFRKIGIDFCGMPPEHAAIEAFRGLAPADQDAELHRTLDECLDTQFWLGFNGVVWSLAHAKLRPLTAFFTEFTNFFDDYAFFTWTQIDDHDVRDMLVGDYLVQLLLPQGEDVLFLDYAEVDALPGQPMQPERRAGLLTSAWPLFYNTMFTALPRATAAQAYRAFLGLDIAKSEGLDWAVDGEPVDYDGAGVTQDQCKVCHATVDPLSYPFSTYNGLQADEQIGAFMYEPNRIEKYFAADYPDMAGMPERGVIFGEQVADLRAWAQVAANSDQFFVARTSDYWELLLGEKPSPEKADLYAEFTALWQGMREHHSVERMLHQLITTEAYGAP
jgi:hypothetical protein